MGIITASRQDHESSQTPIHYYTPVTRQIVLNQVGEIVVGNGFDLTQRLNNLIFVKIVLVRLMRTGGTLLHF